jgi:hypothetical protein
MAQTARATMQVLLLLMVQESDRQSCGKGRTSNPSVCSSRTSVLPRRECNGCARGGYAAGPTGVGRRPRAEAAFSQSFVLAAFGLSGFVLAAFVLSGFVLAAFGLSGFVLAAFVLPGFDSCGLRGVRGLTRRASGLFGVCVRVCGVSRGTLTVEDPEIGLGSDFFMPAADLSCGSTIRSNGGAFVYDP